MAIISENVKKLIQAQIGHEFESELMYLGISNWFETKALFGFAKLYKKQADEERTHALKFLGYLNDRNILYVPEAVNAIFTSFEGKGGVDFVAATLEQEQKVTQLLYNIYDASIQDKDHMSRVFMEWFINEQIEEEKLFTDLLTRCKVVGKDIGAFMDIDRDLSED
jgi:ferritin